MSIDEEQHPCHARYNYSPSPAATPSTSSSLNSTPEKSTHAPSGFESPLEVLSRAASMVESAPIHDENKSNNEVNGEFVEPPALRFLSFESFVCRVGGICLFVYGRKNVVDTNFVLRIGVSPTEELMMSIDAISDE